jgi:glucose/mannose transport system substrate-binding protein
MNRKNLHSRMSALAILLAACGMSACSGKTNDTGSCQGPSAECPEKVLDIMTWLNSGSELTEFNRVLDVMRSRVPGIQILVPGPNPDHPRDPLGERIAEGRPPDAAQFLLGADLGERARQPGMLAPLDDVAHSERFADSMPETVLAAGSLGGHLYAVPLTLERDNTLFFNRSVLERANQKPPTTLQHFFNVAEVLKAQNIAPLAMPAKHGWALAIMLFEDILIAQAGADFYARYVSGSAQSDAPEMVAALETFGRMLDYSSETRGNMSWTDAVQELCAGKAAMLFLPNFVLGELDSRCPTADIDYVAVQGNEPVFVFAALGFSVLEQAPHPFAAREFIKVIGSAEAQSVFNAHRYNVPVRTDVPLEALAERSRKTYTDYLAAGNNAVQAYALSTSAAFQQIVDPAVQRFADPASGEHKNVEAMLVALRDAYATIR